jgi:hypothetical protein
MVSGRGGTSSPKGPAVANSYVVACSLTIFSPS